MGDVSIAYFEPGTRADVVTIFGNNILFGNGLAANLIDQQEANAQLLLLVELWLTCNANVARAQAITGITMLSVDFDGTFFVEKGSYVGSEQYDALFPMTKKKKKKKKKRAAAAEQPQHGGLVQRHADMLSLPLKCVVQDRSWVRTECDTLCHDRHGMCESPLFKPQF